MKPLVALSIATLALSTRALDATAPSTTTSARRHPPAARFHPGQIWWFTPRPGEEGATLTILKLEPSAKDGPLVHVRLSGVRIKNPRAPEGFSVAVEHLPFREDAIARSVIRLAGQARPMPEFEDGYRAWRTAYDAGRASVFRATVAEALTHIERELGGAAPRPRRVGPVTAPADAARR
jgi:hypothetical protein